MSDLERTIKAHEYWIYYLANNWEWADSDPDHAPDDEDDEDDAPADVCESDTHTDAYDRAMGVIR